MRMSHLAGFIFFFACLMFAIQSVTAEGELVPPDPLEASGEDVIIEAPQKELVDEFRINGQLYMIRVNPRKGPPYYLVDADGDGNLETRWNDLAPDLLIPAWVLKRW